MYFDNCKTNEDVIRKYDRFRFCVEGDAEISSEILSEYNKRMATPNPIGTTSDLSFDDRLDKLILWASNQPSFDAKFPIDLQGKIARGLQPTEKQIASIDNIIKRWKVPM